MLKKLLIIVILILEIKISSAEIEDISFSTGWELGTGCKLSGDTLILEGDGKAVVKASKTIHYIPNADKIKEIYFVADVYLENIKTGENIWECPRLLVMHATENNVFAANNMEGLIESKWFFTGTKVENFDKKYVSAIRVEFRVQQCYGTMKIVNPQLLDTVPKIEYSFPLDIPSDLTCTIDLKSNETRPFPKHLISSNTHFLWTSGGWNDPEVRDIIKTRYTLGNLRFPGGTIGNFYDWETDGFYGDSISQLNTTVWTNYLNGYRFHYTDFASLCKETGATATLMFNVMQDDITKATNRLKNRISSGIDIDWIELGNENYYPNQAHGNVRNIDEYISHTKALTSSLKNVKPDIRVAVNIKHDDYSAGSWNDRLRQENYYDAAVIHSYITGNTGMPCQYSFAKMISTYDVAKHRLELFKSHFPNTPLIVTEYGVQFKTTPKNFMSTLASADHFLALLEGNDMGIVQQMGRHMMYHTDNKLSIATSYFRDESGVMNRTSMGVMEEMLIQFFTGSELYNAIGKGAEVLKNVPGMLARAVKRGDSTRILVINKLPVDGTLNVNLDGKPLNGKYSIEYFSIPIMGDTLGYPLTSDPIQKNSGMGNAKIPAYSISIVTYQNNSLNSKQILHSVNNKTILFRQTGSLIHFKATAPVEMRILTPSGRVVKKIEGIKNGILGQTLSRGIYFIEGILYGRSFKEKILIHK